MAKSLFSFLLAFSTPFFKHVCAGVFGRKTKSSQLLPFHCSDPGTVAGERRCGTLGCQAGRIENLFIVGSELRGRGCVVGTRLSFGGCSTSRVFHASVEEQKVCKEVCKG